MTLVIIAPSKKNLGLWKEKIKEEAQRNGLEMEVWIGEEVPDKEKVKMAVVWKHPQQSLHQFANLQLVSSMGAGVDHIISDPLLPAHWKIVRIVDEQLTASMSNYLLAAVLNHHKRLLEYLPMQKKKEWANNDEPERAVQVGILGMGNLGTDIAKKLVNLGFTVAGYSQRKKELEGVRSFTGEQELPQFLQAVNVIICLFPLTADTRGFLNKDLFKKCQPGTFLINVARGEHLVEEDLPPALEKGYLSGAMLDVFRKEPLPAEHPFWQHPQITITPHIASVTKPEAAIPQIVENYRRLQAGETLQNTIDPCKGY